MDALIAVILVVACGLCIMWSLIALKVQFSVPQFIFFGLFMLFLGVFLESWFAGTRELVLSTAGMLVLIASYVIVRTRMLLGRAMGRASR